MSNKERQSGLEALLECKKQVQITIRNYLKEMTEVLRKKKIIELLLYNEVIDRQSCELPDTKARVVYQRLQAMVQQDEQYYVIFVDFLRRSPKFEKTVKMLDKVYGGPEPVVQQEGTQPPSRMSILAGCDTNGVCVPCEYIVVMQGMIQRKNILVF